MKKVSIVLLEEYEKVLIYSIKFEHNEHTEFENFLSKYKDIYSKDIGIIMARIDKIIQDGVFDRHFRYAGKYKDKVFELPNNIETSKLRLYCIAYSPSIIILGNGGLKKSRTYNDDSELNGYVEILQEVDKKIGLEKKKNNSFKDDDILEDLTFTLK